MNAINAPVQFDFHSNAIRVIADDKGEPWFLANDVCAVLGYANPRDAIAKHCRQGGVAKRDTPTESGIQEMTYINEGNLYRLIIKSRKPEAEPFEAWVCDDVLPTLRKTGQYQTHQRPEPPTKQALPGGLTLDMQDAIKQLVKDRVGELPKEKQAKAAITCWSAIKSKYGKTYKAVEPEHFTAIVSLLARLPLEGELLEAPALPDSNSLTLDLSDGQSLKLTFAAHAEMRRYFVDIFQGNVYIKSIEQGFVTTSADLAKLVGEPGQIELKHLPAIAASALNRWNAANKH